MQTLKEKQKLVHFWREHFHFRTTELNAFLEVDRGQFLPTHLKKQAYDDVPLLLLRGKTISQPTTAMIMVAALELAPGAKVFEIGTGSGYQAALMAALIGKEGTVITTEVIPELVGFAQDNLKRAGFHNAKVLEEDGSKGLPAEAPFDGILITAACKEFPPPLIDQLKEGGTIVGPIGTRSEQELTKGTKRANGKLQLEFLGPFLFTPMYGRYGFED